jgi:hypothetical protein
MEWHYAPRPAAQSWQDFFAAQLDRDDEDHRIELLSVSAPREGVCYGAYRHSNKKTAEERVSGLVIELDFSRGDAEVGFKALTEYDGPPQHECPRSIYDLLTRLRHCDESPYAKAWRGRVETWLRRSGG